MKLILKYLLAILLCSTYITATASEEDHLHNEEVEFDEHSAHEHGHATAQVTFINNTLKLELSFPSIDIYGFEHDPHNEEELSIVLKAKSTLNDAENIVMIRSAKSCELKSARFKSSIFDSINTEYNQHEAKEKHHNNEEHNDDEAHNEHHDDDEAHSDVSINYEYTCLNKNLQTITFNIFEYFPTIEELEVQFISDDNQKLFNITPKSRTLTLK